MIDSLAYDGLLTEREPDPEPEAFECLGCSCPAQGDDELCRDCEEKAEEAKRIASDLDAADEHRTSDDYWRQHAGRE